MSLHHVVANDISKQAFSCAASLYGAQIPISLQQSLTQLFLLQVWYDTTLTKSDKPSTCTAFMVTLAPKDGPATGRKQSASNNIILTTTVLKGCKAMLPVLCM